jgi:GxxExxY protein
LKHGDHGDHGDLALLPDTRRQKAELDSLVDRILDDAFKIHRQYGPGLLESAYEAILAHDLVFQHAMKVERQKTLPILHDGLKIDAGYRIDMLVNDAIIIEMKACEKILPVHEAQLLTYMRFSQKRIGLILNFNTRMFKDGIRRLML